MELSLLPTLLHAPVAEEYSSLCVYYDHPSFPLLPPPGDSNTVNRTQLIQRGREWCVLMTCLVAELDFVADTLSATGQAVLGLPAITATQGGGVRAYANVHSKVVPLLQAETARLKDVLACLTIGG